VNGHASKLAMDEVSAAGRDLASEIGKGLRVIQAFNDRCPRMNATEMARCTGMSRTVARRHLMVLRDLGFLDSDGKGYWLTPRVLRLGWGYLESARLPRLVLPHLQRLARVLGEVALCSVLDGDDAVCISRSGANRSHALGFAPGTRTPATVASAGIAVLSCWQAEEAQRWLERQVLVQYIPDTKSSRDEVYSLICDARLKGYAVLEQQLEPGVRGIAVPVKDRHGQAVAALSVSSSLADEPVHTAAQRIVPPLKDAAYTLRSLI
jgi:IclR family transcriptional regulator, pca regulon regulatory protein